MSKDTANKYYYYHMEYLDGRSGWRISKNMHPLMVADLKNCLITFWQEIDEELAEEVTKKYQYISNFDA